MAAVAEIEDINMAKGPPTPSPALEARILVNERV